MNATDHTQLSDELFVHRLITGKLPESLFSHDAHVRLAWINIRSYDIEKAKEITGEQILNYVTHLGAREKFNKTLTVAAVSAVYHFMKISPAKNFTDFINEFPALKNNLKGLLAAHYSFDILYSAASKAAFAKPDLLPFT